MTSTQDYKSQLKSNNGLKWRTYWDSLPQQSSTASIRVFMRGDVFTLHGANTSLVMELLHVDRVNRPGSTNSTGLDYCMINLQQLRLLLQELIIVRGYKCEVYEPVGATWEPTYGSPGNLSCIEHYVFSGQTRNAVSSCKIIALNIKQNHVTCAIVDAELKLGELLVFDDDERHTQLESILIQNQVREAVTNGPLKPAAQKALERTGVTSTPLKPSHFSTPDHERHQRLFAKGSIDTAEHFAKCVNAACLYLKLAEEPHLTTRQLDMSRFVRLDASAKLNLHLDSSHPNEHTIAKMLSSGCSTAQGARVIRRWLAQPLTQLNEINQRHNVVEFFIGNEQVRGHLSGTVLKRMPDIFKVTLKIDTLSVGEVVNCKQALKELNNINHACKAVPSVIDALKQALEEDETDIGNIGESLLQPLKMLDGKIQKLIMLLDSHIDHDSATLRVKSGIDERLDQIQEEMDGFFDAFTEKQAEAAQVLGLNQGDVKLEDTNTEGFIFRAANRHEPQIAKRFDVVAVKRQCVNFTNDKMRTLNERYITAQEEYNDQAMALVKQMLKVASGYSKYMTQLGELTGRLDALLGLAAAAVNSPEPWVRPQMMDSTDGGEAMKISFEGLRHPLLEQGANEVVANDVALSGDKRLMILTGPNMGGKSTYLRSVAVAIILAQIGSFVPAEQASLSVFDSVITRIGAADNLARGVSTFLHEMSECESIFRQASTKSFVAIDELGRGTSTWDGFGLAWSIAEHIGKSHLTMIP